jgi:hypothetical protein
MLYDVFAATTDDRFIIFMIKGVVARAFEISNIALLL